MPDELGRILQRLSLRGRTVALLMAHSGVRPQVVGSYRGERGLVLGDFPDLDLKTLTFREAPFIVRVRAELSKTGAAYISMGSRESAETISAFLASRRASGEDLGAESPVVPGARESDLRGAAREHVRSAKFRRGFLATTNVTAELGRVLHASAGKGERLRPYSLRGYFSTRLMLAEGAGKITRDLRESFLGHDLKSVNRRYNLGKKWGEDVLKSARAQYRAAEPFLSTVPTTSNADRDLTTRKVVLRMHGYTEEELAKIDISTKTDDELIALADAKRAENEEKFSRPGQKAVPIAEVGRMLEAGWEYVGPLGSDQAILRNWTPSLPRP
ncbi:MAG: hypothetical protein ACHQ2Y_08875 [Candidatus Lutacidiplasmatales archaeon]